jgi:hypothetical protein
MRTRVAFVFGQRAKDDAGCFWRYAGSPGRGRAYAGVSHRLWRCAGAFRRGSAIRYCRFRLGSTLLRFNVSVLLRVTLSFSPLFFVVSAIPIQFRTR